MVSWNAAFALRIFIRAVRARRGRVQLLCALLTGRQCLSHQLSLWGRFREQSPAWVPTIDDSLGVSVSSRISQNNININIIILIPFLILIHHTVPSTVAFCGSLRSKTKTDRTRSDLEGQDAKEAEPESVCPSSSASSYVARARPNQYPGRQRSKTWWSGGLEFIASCEKIFKSMDLNKMKLLPMKILPTGLSWQNAKLASSLSRTFRANSKPNIIAEVLISGCWCVDDVQD